MRVLLQLAWRNLGRNARRTGLTAAAVVFAVLLMLLTLAMAAGSHERWIEQAVRLYPGHVQVSLRGYRENRTLEYGMTLSAAERRGLEERVGPRTWAPRLEAFALALPDQDASLGRGAFLIGVEPAREQALSRLGAALQDGRFLDGAPHEVVLGETLARNLDVAPGASVILLSTDYYGSQAAGRFSVVGTLSVGDARFDGQVALVRLDELQSFLEYPDGVSHVAIFAERGAQVAPLQAELEQLFDPGQYEIASWPELVPDMVQFALLDDVGNWLQLGILLVVAGFGILNTILMSVFERVREFGVMRALGVRPRALFALVLLESVLLAVLSIAIGLALALPLILWLEGHPISLTGELSRLMVEQYRIEALILFDPKASHAAWTLAVVMVVALLAALPPAFRASRGRPVDALRET